MQPLDSQFCETQTHPLLSLQPTHILKKIKKVWIQSDLKFEQEPHKSLIFQHKGPLWKPNFRWNGKRRITQQSMSRQCRGDWKSLSGIRIWKYKKGSSIRPTVDLKSISVRKQAIETSHLLSTPKHRLSKNEDENLFRGKRLALDVRGWGGAQGSSFKH
jgi:hypothetical protein